MKKILLVFLALSILTSALTFADPGNFPPPNNEEEIIIKRRNRGNKPHSLNDDLIICHRIDNSLMFDLPAAIYSASVNIYNETEGWIGFITKEDNEIIVPFEYGSFNIECFASDGSVYYGVISF